MVSFFSTLIQCFGSWVTTLLNGGKSILDGKYLWWMLACTIFGIVFSALGRRKG